ncbi:MAG: DegV family protein [Eggerthellaceae bacterium]|jgi:DegV family protein with EDD domain
MAEPKFNLVIDSSCDLPFEVAHRPGITLLSLTYTDGTTERPDDLFESITPHELYESMRQGVMYSTSQVNIQTAQAAFEKLAEEGTPTLSVSFSSGISGTYESCCVAQRAVQEKYPDFELYTVDALVGSTPLGVLIAELLRKRDEGMTARQAYEWFLDARWHVQTLFMVEDLDTLHHGGRIPASVAVAGTKLDVKPMLTFRLDGSLAVVKVVRGRKKGLRQLAEFYLENRDPADLGSWAFIGNSDCAEDVEQVMKLIHADEKGKDATLTKMNIGAVIGCHVGPGMISISFFGPDRRNTKTFAKKVSGILRR